MFRRLLIFGIAIAVLVAGAGLVIARAGMPVAQSELSELRVYAYRGWQSSGVYVYPGDNVTIRAGGEWLYTPDEYHGPEGHPRYSAPSFYPNPGARGGALLWRIGESDVAHVAGRSLQFGVTQKGLLYFRINDDILTDNDGYVTVELDVTPTE